MVPKKPFTIRAIPHPSNKCPLCPLMSLKKSPLKIPGRNGSTLVLGFCTPPSTGNSSSNFVFKKEIEILESHFYSDEPCENKVFTCVSKIILQSFSFSN